MSETLWTDQIDGGQIDAGPYGLPYEGLTITVAASASGDAQRPLLLNLTLEDAAGGQIHTRTSVRTAERPAALEQLRQSLLSWTACAINRDSYRLPAFSRTDAYFRLNRLSGDLRS